MLETRIHIVPSILCFFLCGCRTFVEPPRTFSEPTPVYMAHYDFYHAGLIVPCGKRATEYTYGDWDLFALYNHSKWTKFKGMTFPTKGALGRRQVNWDGRSDESLRAALDNKENCWQLSRFFVSDQKLANLVRQLEIVYDHQLDTETLNEHVDIYFVDYPERYSVWHNCNHELVDWLEKLGCTVRGWEWLAEFEVRGAVITQKKGRQQERMKTDFGELLGR